MSRIDIASASNNDVISNVVLVVELFYLISGDRVHIVSDTVGRLAQSMISETGVVNELVGGSFGVHWGSILMDCGLDGFNLFGFEGRVEEAISEKGNCFFNLTLIDVESEISDLASVSNLDRSTQRSENFVDIRLRLRFGSLK